MVRNLSRLLISLLILGVLGCKRASDPSSGVRIKIPSSQEFYQGNHGQTVGQVVYDRLCFAVQVTGRGIAEPSGPVCSWKKGIVTGYVSPGGELVLTDLPMNVDLAFTLYAYYRSSTSDACPSVPNVITQNELEKTYYLSETRKILLSQNENVSINYTLPQETSHLGTQISLASSCEAKGVAPIAMPVPSSQNFSVRNSRISAGMAASSTNFQAVGRVIGAGMADYPTSTNFKVK